MNIAVADAKAMPNIAYLYNEFATPMRARPIGTFPNRSTTGTPAWLTVFRLLRPPHQAGPDQACIWVWRDGSGVHSEEVASVAWGYVTARHQRCVRFVVSHHFASPNQTMGSEFRLAFARPAVVTPFGPLPRGSYRTDIYHAGSTFLAGPTVIGPTTTRRGTCGFVGRVEADAGVVPHARIEIRSATSDLALRLTTDRWGTFAAVDLPYRKHGYVFSLHAAGYRPARDRWPCFRNDLAIGESFMTHVRARR